MLKLKNVCKTYDEVILDNVSVSFDETGMVGIIGESGCGKSTLLHIIASLDQSYEGEVLYRGNNIRNMKNYIKDHVGFVFQNMYLIDEMSVLENALMSSYFKKKEKGKYEQLLKRFQLDFLLKEKAGYISGGQKQRIAMLRSFIVNNDIVLCDEPTGSLDEKNSDAVFSSLKELSKDRLVIVVSHDIERIKKYCHVLYKLDQGKLILLKKEKVKKKQKAKVTKKRSFFILLYNYLRLSLKSQIVLSQVIFIALLSIMLTFSITSSLKDEIDYYIETLIPSSMVAGRKKNQENVSVEDLKQFDQDYIFYRCMDYSDISLVGFSINDEIFYISDYTQDIKGRITKGKIYEDDHDIVVSKSTYESLCEQYGEDVLNGEFDLNLQYGMVNLSIKVKITGVTDQETLLDTIYLKEYSYSSFCKELFEKQNGDMFFLQVEKDSLEDLKSDYPVYEFRVANENMKTSVDDMMIQIEQILLCFSLLVVAGSLFLLGEVMYVTVIQRKKMFAIWKSLGAKPFHIVLLVLCQGLSVTLWAFLQCVLCLNILFSFLNDIIKDMFSMITGDFLSLDLFMAGVVFVFSILFVLISGLIPVYKANKIDIITCLKGY